MCKDLSGKKVWYRIYWVGKGMLCVVVEEASLVSGRFCNSTIYQLFIVNKLLDLARVLFCFPSHF